jgi:general secretion pathway protein G
MAELATPCSRYRTGVCRAAAGGFTLIELLIVFALMAMLLTLSVPRFLHTSDAAREKVRAQNLATLRDAIDKFKADQGRYPATLPELVGKQYLRAIPVDPVTASTAWAELQSPLAGERGIHDVAAPAAMADSATSTQGAATP